MKILIFTHCTIVVPEFGGIDHLPDDLEELRRWGADGADGANER